MANTIRLDIDRERAKYALKCADEAIGKYDSYIQSMPMMIHNNGLRNALGFAYAKGYLGKEGKGNDWKLVFNHLIKWLDKEELETKTKFFSKDKAEEKLKILFNKENDEYKLAYQETIAVLNWIRKLVKSE